MQVRASQRGVVRSDQDGDAFEGSGERIDALELRRLRCAEPSGELAAEPRGELAADLARKYVQV